VREPGLLPLSRALVIAQGPIILRQARALRRTVPLLPDAPLPWRGRVDGRDGGPEAGLLVLGDSTVAGVGVEHADAGLAGRLAAELAHRSGRTIAWRAAGANGATSRDLLRDHLDDALGGPTDLVVLSIGANDALGLRSARAFGRDVARILARIDRVHPRVPVLVSSLPSFGQFELLPQPLRRSLHRHSLALEGAARRVVTRERHRHMSPPPPTYTEGFFASDLFHPGEVGYRDWARFAVDDAWGPLLERALGIASAR
jgi:hypothetical protein